MSLTDGTITPTGIYVEQENHGFDRVLIPHRVQHDGTLYNSLSPLATHTFGKPTTSGKFTEVSVAGAVVYTEGHPSRVPFATN
jgi:hypothetical protein